MYTAIIKGNRTDANRALENRGITSASVIDYRQHHDETYVEIPESELNTLVRWFCEPGLFTDRGYAAGTLLFYS